MSEVHLKANQSMVKMRTNDKHNMRNTLRTIPSPGAPPLHVGLVSRERFIFYDRPMGDEKLPELREDERWIPGYDGLYSIDKNADVYSWIRNNYSPKGVRSKLQGSFSNGYREVSLFKDGNRTHPAVHRLLLMAFRRLPMDGEIARHLNDNKLDNRLSNLAWGSVKDNASDAIRNGRTGKGEKNGNSKLSAEEVHEIRVEYDKREKSLTDLSDEYNVSFQEIGYIIRGEIWTHVAGPINRDNDDKNRSLTAAQVKNIRNRYDKEEITQYDLANEYGVSRPAISAIITRRNWDWVE